MQITASTFTDPLLRPQLETYYENKKNELYESLKARDLSALPSEVKFTDAEGVEHTGQRIHISAEKMRDALVPFDKWLEFQSENYTTQTSMMTHAEDHIKRLQREGLTRGPEMEAAQEHLKSMQDWYKPWQKAMTDIQTYLLSLQEVPQEVNA